MEFTSKQLTALNSLLPQFYRMETRDTRKARRPELVEPATSLPQKRASSTPVFDLDAETSSKLSEFLEKLKGHALSASFESSAPLSLSEIERQLSEKQYESLEHMVKDLRDLWNSRPSSESAEMNAFTNSLLAEMAGENAKAPEGETAKAKHEKPMSTVEKKTLRESINKLSADDLKGLYKIVKDHSSMKSGQLTFDLDYLPPKVCREIEGYVRQVNRKHNPPKTEEPSAAPPQATPESSDDSSSSDEGQDDAPVYKEQKPENDVSSLYDHFRQTQKETDLFHDYGSMMEFDKPF